MRNILLVLGALLLFFPSAEPTLIRFIQSGPVIHSMIFPWLTGFPGRELAELNKIKDPTKAGGTKLRLPADAKLRTLEPGETIVPITPQEKELLTRLVYAEARGESLEGQIAVAAVILNRVQSSRFPDTVWDVIHQPGQFTPVQNNTLPQTASDTTVEAVNRALRGEDPTGGALFFYNPRTTQAAEYWATKPVIKKIGNHNFTL